MPGFLKLNESTSFAMHALAYLANHPGETISAKDLAAAFNKSGTFLAKIVQRLSRGDLLRNTRGAGGGCALNKDPKSIQLLEVYEIMEGPFRPSCCIFDYPTCQAEHCAFGGLVPAVNNLVTNFLKNYTINDMARFMKGEADSKSELSQFIELSKPQA